MENLVFDYFSSINPLAKKICEDFRKVEKECGSEWLECDWQTREQVLDEFIIHSRVKNHYTDGETDGSSQECSFPKLCISSGEKIVVDFDNDCWTWQDEHSAPFSWKTKSQQDLSLSDLEPTEITKSKTSAKATSQGSKSEVNGNGKFRDGGKVAVSRRIWESPFHVGERKGDSGYPSSQDSIQSSFDDVRQTLDVEQVVSDEKNVRPNTLSTAFEKPAILQVNKKSLKDQISVKSPLKSPISARLQLSPSFTARSKVRSDDTGINLLENKRDSVGQDNAAFVNVLDGEETECGVIRLDHGEWDSFVGESSTDTLMDDPQLTCTSPSRRPLLESNSTPTTSQTYGATNLVAEDDNNSLLSDSSPDKDDKSSPVKTGFDFLDNW